MRHILSLLLLAFSLLVSGQHLKQTQRIEIPFKYSDENFLMALAEDNGIILFRESKARVKNKNVWEVSVLDNDLKERLETKIEVDHKYIIMGYEYRDGYFYLLFDDKSTQKSEFLLVKTSIDNGEIERHYIDNELTMTTTHLLINGESVVLGGYINFRPTFMIFNYKNDQIHVVPGFFNNKSEVLDFNYDEKHKLYNVLMGQKNAINHNEVAVKSFNKEGKVIVDSKYEFKENLRALNGKVIIGNENQIVISGSYAANNSFFSQGYYFGRLSPKEKFSMTYTSFGEVEHFFDYMTDKRKSKMKSKVITAKKNNSTYDFKTQTYVHSVKENNNQFIVLSELYKPEFKENYSPIAMGYASSDKGLSDNTGQKYVSRTSKLTNTEGASHISYHESIMLGFDSKGKLLWDQSLPLVDAESLALEQVSETYNSSDYGVLLYKNNKELTYKSFRYDHKTSIDSTVTIETFNDLEIANSAIERQGKVQYWYDENFIVWGYQKINNSNSTDKKRNIFFINKLLIE